MLTSLEDGAYISEEQGIIQVPSKVVQTDHSISSCHAYSSGCSATPQPKSSRNPTDTMLNPANFKKQCRNRDERPSYQNLSSTNQHRSPDVKLPILIHLVLGPPQKNRGHVLLEQSSNVARIFHALPPPARFIKRFVDLGGTIAFVAGDDVLDGRVRLLGEKAR